MGCCGSQTTGINIEDIFNKKNQYIDDNNSINESNENNNKKNINKKNEINLQQKKKNENKPNNYIQNNVSSNNSKNDTNKKWKKLSSIRNETNNVDNKIKLFGLKNRKFDCYLNSSLQVFFHLKDFNEKIKNLEKEFKDKELINKYLKLIKEIDSIKRNNIILDPKDIKEIFCKIEEKYNYGNQQDANEFISLFLNQMKEEVKLVNGKQLEKTIIPENKTEEEAFIKLENEFFNKYNSFLIEFFYGRLKNEILCPIDKKVIKVNFQVFNMIELLDSSYNTINKLLENYQVEKKIDTKIKIKCRFCKKEYNNYYSKTTIYNLPYYLILYLVNPINNFYEYTIEANKICEKQNNEQYELISSISYYGNYKNGHYFAKCKDMSNNEWYKFSDEHWNKINGREINQNDIILFYKKI